MSNRLVTPCLHIFKNNMNVFIVEFQNKIGDN